MLMADDYSLAGAGSEQDVDIRFSSQDRIRLKVKSAAPTDNYNADIQFFDTDGETRIEDPGISGKYYYLAMINNNRSGGEKFALSSDPVSFSDEGYAEFTTFYSDNGTNQVDIKYVQNEGLQELSLVSTNSSGNKPSISEAKNRQNGVNKITVSEYSQYSQYSQDVLGNYKLFFVRSGSSYHIKAVKMPSYKVTSRFVDGSGQPVTPALSKAYYLVVKARRTSYWDQTPCYYIDAYNPAKTYEISQFYKTPNLNGGAGNTWDPTFSYSDATIEDVYLIEQDKVSDANDAINASAGVKITSGTVDMYSLAMADPAGGNGKTLTFTKSADVDMYTTVIKFFNADAEIVDAAGGVSMHVDESAAESRLTASSLTKTYYVLATLTDKTDKNRIVGWAVNPVSLNGTAETTTFFTEFIPFGVDGSSTEGEKIPYSSDESFEYNISTRLFRADSAIQTPTYKALMTDQVNNANDHAEDGYEFVGNWRTDSDRNEIHLKEASPKKYAVRVRFRASDIENLVKLNDNYYVNVVVQHASSNSGGNSTSFQYAKLDVSDFSALPVDDEGYVYKEYVFNHWRRTDGDYGEKADYETNSKFTGNEQSITVELVYPDQSVTDYKYNTYVAESTNKMKEGDSAGSYSIHYDTHTTNPQSTMSGYHEEIDPDTHEIICYDMIDLILPDASSEYDYATILGPNYAYGIVADHLYQNNDLQTNFAVNHYTGHGDYVTPDLANASGTIVIGEFNRNTDVMTENHVGPAVSKNSTSGEDVQAGTLHIGSNVANPLVIYVDKDSGASYPNNYGGGTPVADQRANVYVSMQDGASLQRNVVTPGIQYGVNMSRTLASKTANYKPSVGSDGKAVVDTTGFPDGATIYIDADALLTDAGTADDIDGTLYQLANLKINKLNNQLLVFNFKHTKNVKLSQFHVRQPNMKSILGIDYDVTENYFNTNTTTGTSKTNEFMNDISQHIVWNFASCTGRVELSEVGGICLQPNYGSETQISGTSGGWLVSNGYVYNNNSEWHNFFSDVPENTEVTLQLFKTVDDKMPKLISAGENSREIKEVFDFTLYEYSPDGAKWQQIGDPVQNERSSVKFKIKDDENTAEADKKLTPGWHVYKVVESQIVPGENNTGKSYNLDTNEYYAAVRVTRMGAVNGQGGMLIVGIPSYFSSFDESKFSQDAVGGNDIPKALSGSLASATFENEVRKEGLTIKKTVIGTDTSTVPFTFKVELWIENGGSKTALTDDDINKLTVTGLQGQSSINFDRKEGSGGSWNEGSLSLKNGHSATIGNLPVGTHYRITETQVNGVSITYTGAAENMKAGSTEGYTPVTMPEEGKITDGYSEKKEFINEYHAAGNVSLHAHKVLKGSEGNVNVPAEAFEFDLYQVGKGFIETQANDANGNVNFNAITFTEEDMEGAALNPSTGKRVKVITYRVHERDGSLTDGIDYDQIINDSDQYITVTLVDEKNGTISASAYPSDFTFRFNNEKGVEAELEGYKKLVGRDMKGGEVFRFEAQETVGNTTKTVATATVRGARDGEKTKFTFTPIQYTEAGEHTYTIHEVVPSSSGDLVYDTISYTAHVTVTKDTDGKLHVSGPVYHAAGNSGSGSAEDEAVFTNISNDSIAVEKEWSDGNANHSNDEVTVKLYMVYGGNASDPTAGQAAQEDLTAAGSHASPVDGRSYAEEETEGSDSTASNADGSHPVAMPDQGYLPAGAVPVRDSTFILSQENGWKHTWQKLPKVAKAGSTWKQVESYYVVETAATVPVERVSYESVKIGADNVWTYKVKITNTVKPSKADIRVVKVREGTETTLAGAEFTLYKYGEENGGDDRWAPYPDSNLAKKTTETDGRADFTQLPDGEYRIKETMTPAGYIKTGDNTIYFELKNGVVAWHTEPKFSQSGEVSWQLITITEANGVSISTDQTSGSAGQTGTQTPTVENESFAAVFTVSNTPGAVLPATGGEGTRMIYLISIMLIGLAGAGFVLIRRRRWISR